MTALIANDGAMFNGDNEQRQYYNNTNKHQCCCKGKYPHFNNHTLGECWTENIESITNKPTKEVGESYRGVPPIIPSPQEKRVLDRFYDLYWTGRRKGTPQSFIDYFEAANFLINEIDATRSTPNTTTGYVDSMTPEERKEQKKIQQSAIVITTQRSTTGDRRSCICESCTIGKKGDCACWCHAPAPHQETEEWEGELERTCPKDVHCEIAVNIAYIKEFIRTLISKEREKAAYNHDCVRARLSLRKEGAEAERNRIVKIAQGMKRKRDDLGEIEGNDTDEMYYDKDTGFNEALTDLIQRI